MQEQLLPIHILPYDPFEDETIVAENVSYKDFLRQFEGLHAEWYQGKVIRVDDKGVKHQQLFTTLSFILKLYLSFRPVGTLIQWACSMRTNGSLPCREPDMMVVFNEHSDIIKGTYLDGVADIAIEIVSPRSLKRDYGNKFEEYEMAGVREYWKLDPLRRICDFYRIGSKQVYNRIPADHKGRLTSTVLPDFALDPALFWREDEPMGQELVELVQKMLKEK